jgi:hypothetical protein
MDGAGTQLVGDDLNEQEYLYARVRSAPIHLHVRRRFFQSVDGGGIIHRAKSVAARAPTN